MKVLSGGGAGVFYATGGNSPPGFPGIGGPNAGNGGLGESNAVSYTGNTPGTNGIANTGSGGGGGGGANASTSTGGSGGSGIVVIRYPSYLAPATSTTGSPQTYIAGSWRIYVFVSSGTITF